MNRIALVLVLYLFTFSAHAGKDINTPAKEVVGHSDVLDVKPDLTKVVERNGSKVWSRRIVRPDASFIRIHLADVNLRKGDALRVMTGKGRVVETITGLGPKDMSTFWSLSTPGDTMVVEFEFTNGYDNLPFRIDRMLVGDADLFFEAADRSICGADDFLDAACYQSEPGKWANVQASVGVMSVGGNANTSLFCSGSNVSPENVILTNQHCVETQGQCDNTEYVFKYYNATCGGTDATQDWVSFRCGDVLAQEPFISCDAGPGDLDFMLTSLDAGDPAATFGYVQPDPNVVTSGEEIYIVQHPDGRPHEITVGSGPDVDVDGSVLRYYTTLDTEGGSSGSPIFRASDDKLIGLHHCGGCSTAGTGNRGMLMSDIYPLIENFVCSEGVSLGGAGATGPFEVTGNGDAIIDPGETWEFIPSVRNGACTDDATNVTADISVNAGGEPVTLLNTSVSFGTIAAGASAASSATVQFQVGSAAVCGSEISFDLVNISADGSGPTSTPNVVSTLIGEEVLVISFAEDFSGGLGSWAIVDGGTVSTNPASTWTDSNPGLRTLGLTEPYAIADSDEFGTPDLLMDEELISPVIDASSGTGPLELKFNHDFNYFSGGGDEQADVDVRSSATSGNWVNVANYSGGDASGAVTIDISDYRAADLQIRFHYYQADWDWWWALDDIKVMSSEGFQCATRDDDGDGVDNAVDNCTEVANPSQCDSDNDGFGNHCDADLVDDDEFVSFSDLGEFSLRFGNSSEAPNFDAADFDCSGGTVNFADLARFGELFGGNPGPAAGQ